MELIHAGTEEGVVLDEAHQGGGAQLLLDHPGGAGAQLEDQFGPQFTQAFPQAAAVAGGSAHFSIWLSFANLDASERP